MKTKKKTKSVKPWITAYLNIGTVRYTVKVPIDVTGSIPLTPYIIKVGNVYAVRTASAPLTYYAASFGKAECVIDTI